MISVVNTGGANITSVMNALKRLGLGAELTTEIKQIQKSSHVLLPGVGAAGDCMQRLQTLDLVQCLRELTQPVLGICLGMQILFERSEEDDVECLGILPGVVKRIRPNDVNLPVPHMGWNKVQTISNDETVPRLLKGPEYFYFTHSFMAPNGPWVTAACEYGGSIPAIVNKANFYGVQFHPEKSGPAGARLLQEFFKL